jgi:hypothetical protein
MSHQPLQEQSLYGAGVISFPRATIGSLSDDVLLEIFDFYNVLTAIRNYHKASNTSQSWHVLVHVCRRWRYVVFGSPRRLELQLVCKSTTPVWKTLDVWPRLPIVISDQRVTPHLSEVNIMVALVQHDRVSGIRLENRI